MKLFFWRNSVTVKIIILHVGYKKNKKTKDEFPQIIISSNHTSPKMSLEGE